MGCSNCNSSSCSGCHSCSSCGSSNCSGSCGCGCIQNQVMTSNCLSQQCATFQPATPTPFYGGVSACQEDHCQEIIQNWYSAAICTELSFNIPNCNSTVAVTFSSLKKIVTGSYLWNPDYGYLKVIAFDLNTNKVTFQNLCNDGNATPGTQVPACTCFIATPTPVNLEDANATCVAVDFTAPGVGACIDITLTNVSNIVVGGQIAIGTGIYTVNAILSSTVITICNDGEGITPGTSVIAKDANGNYQYCIAVVGVSACANTPITQGIPVLCDIVDGTLHPLEQGLKGDLLTLVNAGTHEAKFITPCTATPTATGVVLSCGTEGLAALDSPSAAGTITVPVCIDAVANTFQALNIQCSDYQNRFAYNDVTSANSTGLLVNINDLVNSNVATVTITNSSTCRIAQIMMFYDIYIDGFTVWGAAGNLQFFIELYRQINGGGYTLIRYLNCVANSTAAVRLAYTYPLQYQEVLLLNPASSVPVDIKARITKATGSSAETFNVQTCQARLVYYYIAV